MDQGIIIDLETTGLDPKKDQIIEIAVLKFGWTRGREPFVLKAYSGLQDPGCPLSEEVIKLTGICDDDLRGQGIAWKLVAEFFSNAQVVVAHNAPFDRAFLSKEPQINAIANEHHWACSLHHIDWAGKGYSCKNLNHLAADHGILNPFAHRAIFDCATTLRLISPYLDELVTNSYQRFYRVNATGSPFDKKDLLKNRGYRWDAANRVWWLGVFESGVDQEKAFLSEFIYSGNPGFQVEERSIWAMNNTTADN